MKKQTLRVRFGFALAVFGMAGAAVGCGEINDPVRPSSLPTGGGAASISAPSGATSALASPLMGCRSPRLPAAVRASST